MVMGIFSKYGPLGHLTLITPISDLEGIFLRKKYFCDHSTVAFSIIPSTLSVHKKMS